MAVELTGFDLLLCRPMCYSGGMQNTATATIPGVPVTLPTTPATIAELEFPSPAAAEAFLDYIPLGRRYGATDGTTVLIRFSTHRVYELDTVARTRSGGALVAAGPARKAS